MKKIAINGVTLNLKKKTVLEKVMTKTDAYEFFDVFLKEYLGLNEYPIELSSIEKGEFIDLVLSNYSISNEESFIRASNAFTNRRNTLVGYMMGILCKLNYKVSELINLTQFELFEVFTYEFYLKICPTKPELASAIAEDLVRFGISVDTANKYVSNGLPSSTGGNIEKHEPRKTTEEEDIRELFKNLQ